MLPRSSRISARDESAIRSRFFPLALTMAGAVAAINVLENQGRALRAISDCCVITTTEPWPTLFARLPGAVLAAAPNLPVWGAVVQVLVVVGIAERAIGWRRSLGVGLACHALATLAGRIAWSLSFGAAATTSVTRDTGPSVFVLGLGIYLLRLHFRRSWSTAALVGILVLAAGWSDLAGVEHVVGAAAGWTLAELSRHRWSWRDLPTLRSWRPAPLTRVAATRLRLGWARPIGSAAAVLLVCTTLWHTNNPLAVSAASVDPVRGISAIAVTNRATLPVQLSNVQITNAAPRDLAPPGWWARDRSCVQVVKPHRMWLWRHRLWWCSPLSTHDPERGQHLRLRYWIVGVHQSLRLR